MQQLIFIILSALASMVGAWWIDGNGYIQAFNWLNDSKSLPMLRSKVDVKFGNAYFENFSKNIGDQLTNMNKLRFDYGSVKQIYLKPNMEELIMHAAKTQKIIIDPDQEYATAVVDIGSCWLESVPSNVNQLKRLRKLYLGFNRIKHAKMSDFNGMNNLQELHLSANRIKTLSSESAIYLPKLKDFLIESNNLQEIGVCSWEMPKLESITVYKNKLKFIVNLVDQFPKINEININDNPLVCSWKDDLVRSAENKNIALGRLHKELTCLESDETLVPIECPMVYSLSKQLSNLFERHRHFEQSMRNSSEDAETLKQMAKKSKDENQSLKQTVATLSDQIRNMAKKSNDEIQSLTDQLQQMAEKSNEENQSFTNQIHQISKNSNDEIKSLKQREATLSNQLQQVAKKSNDEIQSLTDQLQQMAKKSNEENQSLTGQLTKLHHSIDDLTEGFYRYVLEKEGGEK